MKQRPWVAIILFFIMDACVKPIQQLPDHSFKIINTSSISLQIDIYRTKQDYYNNVNVFFSGMVPAYDSLSMKAARPDSNTTYYYDIYSPGFTATNWGDSDFSFTTTGINVHSFILPGVNYGLFRTTFLNGNNPSTIWNAVNRYDNSYNSIWQSLTASQQYKQLIIQKSLTGYVFQKDNSGDTTTDTIASIESFFSTSGLCGLNLILNGTFPATFYIYNTSVLPISNNYHVTKDTILLNDLLGYWVMARQ
jgi:hypothetical protein